MTCKKCGKELIKLGELTESEIEELTLINKKQVNVQQALNPATINAMEFSDGQVFEYFRAVYDSKAQADFLLHIFFRNLRKRLNIDPRVDFQIGNDIEDYGVYTHKIDKE